MRPGSIVVTFTKGMSNPAFELLERKRYRMSWGPATVFIHRKLNADGTTVGPPQLNILPSDSVTYEDDYPEIPSIEQTAYPNYDSNEEDDEEEEDDSDDDDDIDLYINRNPRNDESNEDDEDVGISEDIDEALNINANISSVNYKEESDQSFSKPNTPISLSKNTTPASTSSTRLNHTTSSSISSSQYDSIVKEHIPSNGHTPIAVSPLRSSNSNGTS